MLTRGVRKFASESLDRYELISMQCDLLTARFQFVEREKELVEDVKVCCAKSPMWLALLCLVRSLHGGVVRDEARAGELQEWRSRFSGNRAATTSTLALNLPARPKPPQIFCPGNGFNPHLGGPALLRGDGSLPLSLLPAVLPFCLPPVCLHSVSSSHQSLR